MKASLANNRSYFTRSKIAIKHAKNLRTAFNEDKAVVVAALLKYQKRRDKDNKPTNVSVSSQEVENAFNQLEAMNVASGIYDPLLLPAFCRKADQPSNIVLPF